MPLVDPIRNRASTHARTWQKGVPFRQLLVGRLRAAPWLLLSAGIHCAFGVALWAVVPARTTAPIVNKVAVAPPEPPVAVDPPPPAPPETWPEEITDDVLVTETTVSDKQASDNQTFDIAPADSARESAFQSDQWTSAVGGGGGAGGRYVGRAAGGKKSGGGGKSSPEAIDAGLQWLKDHQDEDGKWDSDQFMKHDDPTSESCDGPGSAVHDIGVTGLALLAFLGDGSTMRSGIYKDTVKRGVIWLRSQQQENGLFGTNTSRDFIYDHAIASYAMCEAFGLSNSQLLRDVAQKGLDYLESHRNPGAVWRYQPRDGDNDTSVTGWCIMAYASGEFFGLDVNQEALQCCATWLDQISDATGLHGYRTRGEPSSRKPGGNHAARYPPDKGAAMTAVGLFCRCFLNQDPRDKPVMKAAADLIAARPPVWDEQGGSIDHYYWYYATYALFQMGGTHWTEWQKKLESAVVKHQHRDRTRKNLYGSWDPKCAWGEDGGRVYSTAILTLTLEAYYRYTRLVH